MIPKIPELKFTGSGNFFLLAGPCLVESDEISYRIAEAVSGIFLETHPDPANAKSDDANIPKLDMLEGLLGRLVRIRDTVNNL